MIWFFLGLILAMIFVWAIWYEAPDAEYYEDSHIAKFEIYGHENCEECVWNAESKTRILP